MRGKINLIIVGLLLVALAGVAMLKHGNAEPLAAPTDIGGQGSEITLVASGVHTGSGASDWRCDEGQFTSYTTEVKLVGTMTGTNPSDTITIQHSIDRGTSVAGSVAVFPAINATTVPAVMTDMRINDVVIANTPVAYGRCQRASWVAVATGTASANFEIVQYRH